METISISVGIYFKGTICSDTLVGKHVNVNTYDIRHTEVLLPYTDILEVLGIVFERSHSKVITINPRRITKESARYKVLDSVIIVNLDCDILGVYNILSVRCTNLLSNEGRGSRVHCTVVEPLKYILLEVGVVIVTDNHIEGTVIRTNLLNGNLNLLIGRVTVRNGCKSEQSPKVIVHAVSKWLRKEPRGNCRTEPLFIVVHILRNRLNAFICPFEELSIGIYSNNIR